MGVGNLGPHERETVVNASDGDELVRIWTAQPAVIGRLRRSPAATQTQTGYHGTTEWAEFTIPAERWNPVSGVKKVMNLTDEQRAEIANRLRRNKAEDTK